eukprot:gnl/TRDRNA2_/TRDRNA2_166973_c2_seq1.p1 gnl/TRDRNA2_/TRDRNA2_166973_c2~~gnl/TRDRNA2_/TRDRNA2_166973_c2_seq1.p1  ORF type:complete len:130 (+),score=33.49 gnl/TRDRNA2_/TRDRNA2_166973_c2_seq1:3-392(+)
MDCNQVLDSTDVQCGMNLLMKEVLPKQVLKLCNLTTDAIVIHVVATVLVLLVVFCFLMLSFISILAGRSGPAQSMAQSLAAGGAAFTVGGKAGISKEQIKELVSKKLEQCIGTAARFAAQMETQRMGRS